jgi:hypothetical protein
MRSRRRLVQPAGKRGIVWVAMDDTAPHSYLVERCRRAGEAVRELRWNQYQDGRRPLGRVVALGSIRDDSRGRRPTQGLHAGANGDACEVVGRPYLHRAHDVVNRLPVLEDSHGALQHDARERDGGLLRYVGLEVDRTGAAAQNVGAARVAEDQRRLGLVADGYSMRGEVASDPGQYRHGEDDEAVPPQRSHDPETVPSPSSPCHVSSGIVPVPGSVSTESPPPEQWQPITSARRSLEVA